MTDVQLWQRYVWRQRPVVVIQRWDDPFGRAMLRFADPDDEEMAAGMPVDEFLAEAIPAAP